MSAHQCPHCYVHEGYLHQGWCPTQESFARASQQAQCNQWYAPPVTPRPMTPADLGIVDELLDDKIGMDL